MRRIFMAILFFAFLTFVMKAVEGQTISSFTPSSSCIGGTVTIVGTNLLGTTSISNSVSINGTSAVIQSNTDTEIKVVISSFTTTGIISISTSNGTTNSTPNVLTIGVSPIFTSAITAIRCSNVSTNYTATSATSGTTFSWTRAVVAGISNLAGSASSASATETLINTTASPVNVIYVYTLTANGCSNTQNVTVTVNPTPTLSSSTAAIRCSNTSFTYTPTSATINSTFTWTRAAVTGISNVAVTTAQSLNPNETLINTTASPVSPVNVVYAYTITANTCANTQNVTVTVNPNPVITAQTATICSGAPFTVSPANGLPTAATIVPANTTYTWTVVDNPNVTGDVAAVTAQTSISQTLTNNTNLVQTVTYTVTPSGAAGNCVGATFTVTVTVNPKPVIPAQTATICSGLAFTIAPANGSPTVVTIVPASTTYTWTVVDNTNVTGYVAQAGAQMNISQTLTNNTNVVQTVVYTVTPTSGAAGNCVGATFTVTVTVNPKPVIPAQTATICSASAFTVSPTNGSPTVATIVPANTTYTWTVVDNPNLSGDVASVTAQANISQTLTNNTNLVQTVTYTVTPASGAAGSCVGATFTLTVRVKPLPSKPSITFDKRLTINSTIPSSNICEKSYVNFSAATSNTNSNTSSTVSFLWSLSGGTGGRLINQSITSSSLTNPAGENAVFYFDQPQAYNVSVKVTVLEPGGQPAGCSRSDTIIVKPAVSTPSFKTSDSTVVNYASNLVCLKNDVFIDPPASTVHGYQWGFDSLSLKQNDFTSTSNPSFSFVNAQNYNPGTLDVSNKYYWVLTKLQDPSGCYRKSYLQGNLPLRRPGLPVPVSQAEPIKIFPNPAANNVVITWRFTSVTDEAIVNITDATGKKVLQMSVPGSGVLPGRTIVNVASLQRGVYFVNILFNNKITATGKLIKE